MAYVKPLYPAPPALGISAGRPFLGQKQRKCAKGYSFKLYVSLILIPLTLFSALPCNSSPSEESTCDTEGSVQERCNLGFAIVFDNDLLVADSLTGLNEDRDYTMGLGFVFRGYRVVNWPGFSLLNDGINFIESLSVDDESDFPSVVLHTATIADTAFTPDDLSQSEPVIGDRPYSNLLYISLEKTKAYEGNTNYAVKNTLNIGVIGLSIGKGVQREIHCDWDMAECPQGWENQISNGGELTALWRQTHLYNIHDSGANWRPKISAYYEFDIGYYTDAALGMHVRLGHVNSPFYTHYFNPLQSANMGMGPQKKANEFYFFLNVGARAIAYNALLQGQFRNNTYDLSYSDLNPILGEASLGC